MRGYLGKKAFYSTVITALLVLGGCSSSDGDSSGDAGTGGGASASVANGTVVDGYIAGGHLYADLDASKDENTGDINTTTDAEGNFSFGETTVAHGTYLYVSGGTDLALNAPFTGELSAYFFGEATVVSPLSTLIVSLMQNEGLSYDAAKARAAAMMGLTEEQVVADPFAEPVDTDLFIASQRIVSAATMLGGDFSTAVDALASSDMNITAAAAALVPAADPADAEAVDAYIVDLQAQMPADATADDLAAYQLLIVDAVSNPTEIPDIDDAVAVADALACVTFDAIKGSNTAENNITTDLVLDSCENVDDNVSFVWNSDNTALISDMGAVVSPVYVGGNINFSVVVTSDANSSVSTEKTFALSVPRLDNHLPVAVADVNATDEEVPLSFNVLANDTDEDNDELTLTAVSNGVDFSADGTVTYTPALDFNGDFVFTYTVQDSWGDEVNGTVTVTVTPLDDAPVLDAIADQIFVEDFITQIMEINASDVDTDAASLVYSVVSIEPAIVNATFTDNQLEFTSHQDIFGDTNVTVMVSDGDQNDTKTFVLTIAPVDDAPVLNSVSGTTFAEDLTGSITVLAVDVENDAIVYSASEFNTSLVTADVVGGLITFTGLPNANGSTDVNITATANGLSDSQTITIVVSPVNDVPVITSVLGDMTYDEDFSPSVSFPLTADDAEGDEVTYTVVSTGAEVNATISGTGTYNLRLEATPDAFGDANITVTANDGSDTSEKSFILHITAINDTPVMTPIANVVKAEDDESFIVDLNATDIDSENLVFSATPQTNTLATLSVSGTTLTITPLADANGGLTITVQASDSDLSDSTTFDLNVTAVNDDPTANDFAVVIVTSSSGNTIDLSSHIDDVDGDSLSVTSYGSLDGLSLNEGTTTFTYDNNGSEGIFSFGYTVEDGNGGLPASGTVSLNVSTTPIYPVAVDDNVSTNEEIAVNIDVLSNDSDAISITDAFVFNPDRGSVVIEANNTITFTPADDESGTILLQYTAQSATGHDDNGTVSVRVFNINDAPVISFVTPTPLNLTEETIEQIVRVDLNITDVDTDLSSVSVIDATSDNGAISIHSIGDYYVELYISAFANGDANITVTANDGEDNAIDTFAVHVAAIDSTPVITTTLVSIDLYGDDVAYPLAVEPADESFTLSLTDSGNAGIAAVSMNVDGVTLDISPIGRGETTVTVHAVNDSDGALNSDTVITINVYDPSNVAPVAGDNEFSVEVDGLMQKNLAWDDLGNPIVYDDNNDQLTYILVTPPAHGTVVSITEWGDMTYVASEDAYIGDDSFTFKVNDGLEDSNVATVTVHVTASPYANEDDRQILTLEEFNALAADTIPSSPMYEVEENGWDTQSELYTMQIQFDEPSLTINGIDNFATPIAEAWSFAYTLDITDGMTALLDFPDDLNQTDGVIDEKLRFVATVTGTDLAADLNMTLPDDAVGYKMAFLRVAEEYDEWADNQPETSEGYWDEVNQVWVEGDPFMSLDAFMADKSYDPNNPTWNGIWVDGYNFKFAQDSNLSSGADVANGTIVRTVRYYDHDLGYEVEVVTNANAGTWELVFADGKDRIKVTPTVYEIDKIKTYQLADNGIGELVYAGEYRPANQASLEFWYDESTMYHIGNSIMNRTIDLPSENIVDATGEFISFNSLNTAVMPIDTSMYGIWAWDDQAGYMIDLDELRFESNNTFSITESDGGFSAEYTIDANGEVATLLDPDSNPFIDAKLVAIITDAAELSSYINIPEIAFAGAVEAYRFAHINYNAEFEAWDTFLALDGSSTFADFDTFQTAFMDMGNPQVALSYTDNGGVGFASGVAGVGGTLAEYDGPPNFNVVTPNAGTWEVVMVDGQQVMTYDITVPRHNSHTAAGVSDDCGGVVCEGKFNPADSGNVEFRYSATTRDEIVTYLQDQNASGNPLRFEIETDINRELEVVAFTNNKMNRVEFDMNQTTCERSVSREYIWLDGDAISGNFVISDEPQSFTYLSSDGEIATVNDGTSDVFMAKVNEELNATQLMSETGLFLPMSAHGYRISYMDLATGQGGTEVKLDDVTIGYLESYFNNNHMLDDMCGAPAP